VHQIHDRTTMNFDDEDRLELQFLAGGNIVEHAPVFSPDGRLVPNGYYICNTMILVYQIHVRAM